jgi:hypothetical protein
MLTGFAAMLIEKEPVADPEPVSVTLTVKLGFPAAVGVPEIWPDELRFSPAGNEPDAIDQLYVPVPPLACSVCEYATPT